MFLLLLVVLMLGSFYVPAQSSDQLLYVFIDADSGEDSTKCLNSTSTAEACQSLSFVAEHLTQKNLVVIEMKSELLVLTKPVEFNSYTYLTICGSGNTTLHCNVSNAGLAFVSVKNLIVHSVTIDHCGALRESTSVGPERPRETELLNVAVYLLNCTDVSIQSVDVQSSNGTGLSIYDTNGTVNIEYCNFIGNRVDLSKTGGGGLHIEFTICSPGTAENCSGHDGRNHLSKYTIQNCTFRNNVANCPLYKHEFILPSMNRAVGKGGGLYISIDSHAVENIFTVTDCHFVNNSASFVAGGMLVEFLNSAQRNTISVYNASFFNNSCFESYVCSGGGLVAGFMFYTRLQLHEMPYGNSFLCHNCRFEHNSAYMGGGTGIFATKEVHSSFTMSAITFSQCTWTENTSPLGAAVFVTPGIWDFTAEGFLPVPIFTDCRFESNSAIQSLGSLGNGVNVTSLGYGAVFISELRVQFSGNSHFSGNRGSAVHLSSSVLEFCEGSYVVFYNNTGHNGGAIAMYGSSVIHINHSSSFNFTNNAAYSAGGAIYVDFTVTLQSAYRNCFIQPGSLQNPFINSDFYFIGNYAKRNGASIFATSFKSCKTVCHNRTVSIKDPQSLLQCFANFNFGDSRNGISTHPNSFTLHESTPVRIIPGSEHHLPLSVADESQNNLTGIVYDATVTSDLNRNVRMVPAFSQVSSNTISIFGNIGDDAVLYLDTSDVTVSFDITLVDCKPGYIPNNKTCECAATEYLGLITCDPKVLLRHGYWMGFCAPNSKVLCTGYCPYGFCSYHKMNPKSWTHPLPDNSSSLDYQICGPYRTGRLCGKCADNHSVYFHSWKYTCGPERLCHLGWFFYLLSEILPLTLFFLIILVFNISFTSGNINCFVFYAQILDALATNTNEFPFSITIIRDILTFFYRPFNLNFFSLEQLSFCLWKGASVMDLLIIRYATVGFALVLVLLTILVVRSRCGRFKIFSKFYTPNSILIHGLSAFFVLCYSQCARVTFHILTYFCLYSTDFYCKEKAVNHIGYMNYFEGDHVKYAIAAIFVLIFLIIIPPLLLLLYPLMFKLLGLCKLSESKLVGFLWRVMPIQLLDSFQSSFKDNFRFFAGLYFFYRAIILSAYAYTRILLVFYIIVQIQLTVALALHAIFQPHKKRRHNIIDSLLFTNLTIINGITLYNYTAKNGSSQFDKRIMMESIQVVLMFLPFLCIIVLGVKKLTKKIWSKIRATSESFDDLPPLRIDEPGPPYQKM